MSEVKPDGRSSRLIEGAAVKPLTTTGTSKSAAIGKWSGSQMAKGTARSGARGAG